MDGGCAGYFKSPKLLRTLWSEQAMLGGKGSPGLERTSKERRAGRSELENKIKTWRGAFSACVRNEILCPQMIHSFLPFSHW